MFSPENYLLFKHVHLTLVLVSVVFFVFRFIVGQTLASRPARPWFRFAPHVIDTCLLLSGIALMLVLHLSPLVAGWLGLKLVLVVVYILFGMAAMKWVLSKGARWFCFIAALVAFSAIGALASLKPF